MAAESVPGSNGRQGIAVPLRVRDQQIGRQSRALCELERFAVRRRQGAGQAEADGADLGVGRRAELRWAAAEHLRRGVQLDVDLEAQGGVEPVDHLVERNQRLGHADAPSVAGGPPTMRECESDPGRPAEVLRCRDRIHHPHLRRRRATTPGTCLRRRADVGRYPLACRST
jgi:hypothetical protein